MVIQPIETRYKGYKFRSRLEARWSVYFDALGIKWEYENEGFVLPDGIKYLPDFYFTTWQVFGEVKPKIFTLEEFNKCRLVGKGCILFDTSSPANKGYYLAQEECSYKEYLEDVGYYRVDLAQSQYKDRVWMQYNEELNDYNKIAADIAKSARFEHGEHP